MALAKRPRTMTVEEFLDWHEQQEERYELVDGVPIPKRAAWTGMAGAELAHSLICTNCTAELAKPLRERGCEVFGPDAAVRTSQDRIRYPDLSVSCSDEDLNDRELSQPKLVMEVLSRTTRVYDLREKRAEYQALPSVIYILFIDPDIHRAKLLSRVEGEGWISRIYFERDDVIELPLLGVELAMAEIFRRVPDPRKEVRDSEFSRVTWLDD